MKYQKIKIKSSLFNIFKFLIRNRRRILIIITGLICLFILLTIVLNLYYGNKLSPYIKNLSDTENLGHRDTALILGAGVNGDGEPSSMLEDRLDVGYQLLKQGKVSKLILSGDNREVDYNEPQAMITYLTKKGISPEALVPDYAGRRTYDSCYRAKNIFGQDKIYLITQDFHMVRAVYLCKSLGIDVIGITSDLHVYEGLWMNVVRDYLGMISAVIDTKITKPQPVLGDKINIK